MVTDNTLTPTEARVIWTILHNAYTPVQYVEVVKTALVKLCNLGGNHYACRDCPEPAPQSSRLGGFVCEKHKAQEMARVEAAKENK